MNRRELLQLFGAGAIAVPVMQGVPLVHDQVKLVEPAKVEPVEAKLVQAVNLPQLGGPSLINVEVWHPDGTRITFSAQTFFYTPSSDYKDVKSGLGESQRFKVSEKIVWTLQGECLPNDAGYLALITTHA